MKNSFDKSFLDFSSIFKQKTRFRIPSCYCMLLVLLIGSHQYVTFALKFATFENSAIHFHQRIKISRSVSDRKLRLLHIVGHAFRKYKVPFSGKYHTSLPLLHYSAPPLATVLSSQLVWPCVTFALNAVSLKYINQKQILISIVFCAVILQIFLLCGFVSYCILPRVFPCQMQCIRINLHDESSWDFKIVMRLIKMSEGTNVIKIKTHTMCLSVWRLQQT